MKLAAMVDPAIKGAKASLEQHHLFPREYLEDQGVSDLKLINQIANFAPVEWPANIKIGKQARTTYVPALDAALSGPEREHIYHLHALPPLWWEMPYSEFLVARRLQIPPIRSDRNGKVLFPNGGEQQSAPVGNRAGIQSCRVGMWWGVFQWGPPDGA